MRHDDLELTPKDIQALANRDAIARFFANLGYDTRRRGEQKRAAIGLAEDVVAPSITYIERVAREDGGLLEIYLIELSSVTIRATHALAHAVCNARVQFPLLVLTDDYQFLDFVLVQRDAGSTNALAGCSSLASSQVTVKPRVITVNRQHAGKVELCVLRRFSFTENNPAAQYEKLLRAAALTAGSEPYIHNWGLFSDYYLTKRFPENPQWQNKTHASLMTAALQKMRTLFENARFTFANAPASTLQSALIAPTLDILGFAPRPPGHLSSQMETITALHATDQSNRQLPLVQCLAYAWGRNLDSRDDRHDSERPEENPGAVVLRVLDQGQTEWAILTNGNLWRLYSAKAHRRATHFYEIDVEEMLALPEEERARAFRYFWSIFRVSAFQPVGETIEGETRQRSLLDGLISESERSVTDLGVRLKDRIFHEIFPLFARGFLAYARQRGLFPTHLETVSATEQANLLSSYFAGTLAFLFRLLFLLHAESQNLLPVRETRGYYGKSIVRLTEEIAAQAGPREDLAAERLHLRYMESTTTLYDRLLELFNSVDTGDAAINLPSYNADFVVPPLPPLDTSAETRVARFLTTHKIPDLQLALGLDRLTRDPDERTKDLEFIDFKSLGLHLPGRVYEGLLGFTLRIALTDMVRVKGKKAEERVPYAEAVEKKLPIIKAGRGKNAKAIILPQGSIYLEQDRSERKATGSYYTPEYIARSIVEQTVGPILRDKLEALRPLFHKAEQTLDSKREQALRRAVDPEYETYLEHRQELNEVFFDLTVVDPAMGSGHFLVEALAYITERMASFLSCFPWNPIVYELALTRRGIQQDMERQGVSVDMSILTDLNLLTRRVLSSCIYGVDLNQMAVQLAKVSLWLACGTPGTPLSFLDHHLKWGNALIGSHLQDAQQALTDRPGSIHLPSLLAAQLKPTVGVCADATARECPAPRSAYQDTSDALAPLKRVLHVWVSEYFGNAGAQQTTLGHAEEIYMNTYARDAGHKEREIIEKALHLAEERQFFHWELEFPEVFFAATGGQADRGFDAVIGNPPYDILSVREKGAHLTELLAYIHDQPSLKPANGRKMDVFRLFLLRGIELLKSTGYTGQILPLSLLADQQAASLRAYLLFNCRITGIDVFPQKDDPHMRVFSEAKLPTCILHATKRPEKEASFSVISHPGREFAEISGTYTVSPADIEAFDRAHVVIPIVQSTAAFQLARRLSESAFCVHFGKLAQTFQGEINETSMAACISRAPTDGIPILRGGHVQRYSFSTTARQGQAKFLILDRYTREIEGKKASHPTRLRLGYQRNAALDNWRRLIWGPLPHPCYCFDSISYLLIEGASTSFYLALLNARLLEWRFRLTSSNNHVSTDEVAALPIRRISFSLPADLRSNYVQGLQDLCQAYLNQGRREPILDRIASHLSHWPEESEVVHDLLGWLAETMIALHRKKQVLQQDFLSWLETVLQIVPEREGSAGIVCLTGKTELAQYPGDYQKGEPVLAFEALLDILYKNKKRLGVNLNDKQLVDMIGARYRENIQMVLPIKDRLRRTDALIDAVVYRLYGLTEEEIRIVEGHD